MTLIKIKEVISQCHIYPHCCLFLQENAPNKKVA